MITQPTTLAEAGWIAYWDPLGQHPVKDGDAFPITPSDSISVYYICKPVQEEDGKWYANGIYAYEPFQHFIGGAYKKEVVYSDSLLCGTETGNESLSGKVEEFALWGKGLGLSGLINYQTNQTGMIGGDTGDRYATEQEALADSLNHYFNFGTTSQLVQNFKDDNSASLVSRTMVSGSGKFGNSSVFDANDDFISIENTRFAYDFTMNIRFYMEDNKDFVLFRNKNTIEITYNEVAGTFDVSIYPYIGDIVTYSIEVVNMKVHHWYDFGVLYEDGKLFIVMDGNELESHQVNITVGGVERISLHHANVESVQMTNFHGGNTMYGSAREVIYPNSSDPVSESIAPVGRNVKVGWGGRNLLDMMIDRETNAIAAFSSSNLPSYSVGSSVTDQTYDTRTIVLSSYHLYWRYYQTTGYVRYYHNIQENTDGSVNIFSSTSFSTAGHASRSSVNATFEIAKNILKPGIIIKLKVNFKSVLEDSQDIFPMMSMVPGTHMKVFKQEMIPPTQDMYDLIRNGYRCWGTYWTSTNVSYGRTNYPAMKNITGKKLQVVTTVNGGDMIYVPNGYICYHNGSNLVLASEGYSSTIYPDTSLDIKMNFIPTQDD